MYSDTKAKLVAENRKLRAEVERLRGVVNDLGEMLGDVRKQRDAATARAEASEKEALEYIDYRNQAVISRNAMERRLEAAEALVAGLREVLEAGKADRWAATVGNTETNAFRPSGWVVRAEAALALTPASAGARLKAEAYREAAQRILNDPRRWPTVIANHIVHDLCAEADRLTAEAEKEAANGPK